MRLFRVRNFERFQHYQSGRHAHSRPAWIKFYASVLTDYEITRLPDSTKAHLLLIWVLASQMENKLPWDPRWIGARIGASEPVDLKALEDQGFIECLDTPADRSRPCLDQIVKSGSDLIYSDLSDSDPDPKNKNPKKGQDEARQQFDRFYGAYPRHEGKEAARAAFRKLHPSAELLDQILADALVRYRGIDPSKIPHPSTYLNQKRWEDEQMPSQLKLVSNGHPEGTFETLNRLMTEERRKEAEDAKKRSS